MARARKAPATPKRDAVAKKAAEKPARRAARATPTDDAAARAFTFALGSAAHELKNGLGPLAMTLQLAERKLLLGESVPPQDLSFARAQVRRLSHLVNDLLDVTHLDTDQFPLRARAADLAATVAEAVDTFQRGNVRQIARVLPAAPVPATFDPDRIFQVIVNLLENAAKYAPLPAPISVTLARVADGARVEVRDGGPGLAPEQQGRLFARFVRARDDGDGTRGLGLGLFLCRAIIERHGGRIGVDSAPGAGATFWFELPLS
ncbi:MAG TPA: HAMP domain-containing sensor histidine kinase [Polyangia bacterium]|jgi:signal transduction histidine kinase|nr:HAMP domain-containing sensor histidine kinase [Polyangia bacterium]